MLATAPLLKTSRRLALTPGVQQALRLLRLSAAELREEVQSAYEANPLLEAEHTDPGETRVFSGAAPQDAPALEQLASENLSLSQHLLRQTAMLGLDERRQAAVETIVGALDDDGYLREPLETLQDHLRAPPPSAAELEQLLRLVQKLDPVGCGARSLSECLAAQLGQRPANRAHAALARSIVEKHLTALAAHDYRKIRRACGCGQTELEAAVTLIRALNPRPGSQIGDDHSIYVIPDLIATRDDGRGWRLRLNPRLLPRLSINKNYRRLLTQSAAAGDRDYLKKCLAQAHQLIYGVNGRNRTLLRVGRAILERQRGFIEHRELGLRPLTARHVAQRLSLHESTVCRATKEKYMMTPAGLYELRYFFSTGLGGENGHSAAATKARIRELLAHEDRAAPLSDRRIAERLNAGGVRIARRTVAKYRENMRIPTASVRRAMRFAI